MFFLVKSLPVVRLSLQRSFSRVPSAPVLGARSNRPRWTRWVTVALTASAFAAVTTKRSDESSPLLLEHEADLGTPSSRLSKKSFMPLSTGIGRAPTATEPQLPEERAVLTRAPAVPPPVARRHAVHLIAEINTTVDMLLLDKTNRYEMWTFNGSVPGPFIRARVGDVLEVRFANQDKNGIGHNIDFHCVTGPGGGAPALYAEEGQTRVGTFKLLHPGLFVYHCSAEPVASHIANGMYGLVLVEPEEGLPPADREYYVMQNEFYTEPAVSGERNVLEYSYANGLKEDPSHVVFNGRVGALTERPLRSNQGERVRIYFGNIGPNLVSSFHVIGAIFDKVYREGDLISPPARSVQTTIVPAGGAAVVEIVTSVPGNFTLLDHSIFRMEKGCIGFLKVSGANPRTDIYAAREPLNNCPNCKLHS